MSAGTEAFISTVAAALAAVAAVFALVIAVIALVVARKTLKEARETTEAQRETLGATEALVHTTGALVTRIEASTRVLHLILGEAQATRELEQLRRIAGMSTTTDRLSSPRILKDCRQRTFPSVVRWSQRIRDTPAGSTMRRATRSRKRSVQGASGWTGSRPRRPQS
jgi:hypothetical protein